MNRDDLARRLAWLAYTTLLLQQAADAALREAPAVAWLFRLVPLLLFLPGMLRDNLRSYIWLCFVSLGYFAALVIALFERPHNPLLQLGMVSVVVLFTASMLFVRWRAMERRDRPAAPPATGD